MKPLARFLALSFLVIAFAGPAGAEGLDGVWGGVLKVAPDATAPTARETSDHKALSMAAEGEMTHVRR